MGQETHGPGGESETHAGPTKQQIELVWQKLADVERYSVNVTEMAEKYLEKERKVVIDLGAHRRWVNSTLDNLKRRDEEIMADWEDVDFIQSADARRGLTDDEAALEVDERKFAQDRRREQSSLTEEITAVLQLRSEVDEVVFQLTNARNALKAEVPAGVPEEIRDAIKLATGELRATRGLKDHLRQDASLHSAVMYLRNLS